MQNCEFLLKCLFFNDKLKDMPKASGMMKKAYCKWHYAKCGRFKIAKALGEKAIPADLYPGDALRANELLSEKNKK